MEGLLLCNYKPVASILILAFIIALLSVVTFASATQQKGYIEDATVKAHILSY